MVFFADLNYISDTYRGLDGAGDPQRHPGARARSDPAAVVHGRGHHAHRPRRHLLDQPSASVLRRAPVGDARPPDARARRVERRDLAQPQPVGQLRRGAAGRPTSATTAPTSSWRSAASCGRAGTRTPWSWTARPAVFADPAKVHRIEHAGRFFKSRGPLNVVRSPQNGPAILQAGTSGKGRDFAARYADAIFAIQPHRGRQGLFRRHQGRHGRAGRDPDACKILFGVQPIVGATGDEARGQAGRAQRAGAARGRPGHPLRPSRLRSVDAAARRPDGASHRAQAAAHADALPHGRPASS